MSAPVLVNGQIWIAGATGLLYCFDPNTNASCAGHPNLSNGLGANTNQEFDIVNHGNLVYVSGVETNTVTCVDVAALGPCAGWPSPVSFGNARNVLNRHDATGAVTGVCAAVGTGSGWNLACANDGNPQAMTTYSNFPAPDNDWAFTQEAEFGTRTLMAAGPFAGGVLCWDWSTNAACTGNGWNNGALTTDVNHLTLPTAYGVANDGSCGIAYGDAGRVYTVDPAGFSPCTSLTNGGPARTADLRAQRCDNTVGNATWDKIAVQDTNLAAGTEFQSFVVTVKDAATGAVVAGSDLIGTNGNLDLSGVDPNAHPSLTFVVNARDVAGDPAWADNIAPHVVLLWHPDAMQGCFDSVAGTIDCNATAGPSLALDAILDDNPTGVHAAVVENVPPCPTTTTTSTSTTHNNRPELHHNDRINDHDRRNDDHHVDDRRRRRRPRRPFRRRSSTRRSHSTQSQTRRWHSNR